MECNTQVGKKHVDFSRLKIQKSTSERNQPNKNVCTKPQKTMTFSKIVASEKDCQDDMESEPSLSFLWEVHQKLTFKPHYQETRYNF